MAEIDNRFKLTTVLPAFFTLIVGAIFGGSMIFVTPPFNVPEEGQHFLRCYQCSKGKVFASLNSQGVPGGELPASLADVSIAIHGTARNEFELVMSPEKIKKALAIPLEPGRKQFAGFPSTGRFSPVPYLPAAVAISIGRRAHLTALELLYAGRAGTLTGYLLLVVAAVWLMPVHKWLMSLVALMPMSIFLAASISADALTIAFSLLAIAMILRLALQTENVRRRDLGWLAAILMLLALVKPAYFLIAFLFLIVPKEKFASKVAGTLSRRAGIAAGNCWRVRALMLGLSLAVSVAWAFLARDACVPYRPCVDVSGQAHWMLAHAWPFAERVFSRLTEGFLYSGVIGTLGWGTIWLKSHVYYIYWGGLLAAAVFDPGAPGDDVRLPMWPRALSVGVYVLVLTAVATLTFLFWHSVGEDVIHGVQARYFVPVLPLLLLPLRAPAKLASSRFSRWFVPITAMVVVVIGIGATWQAFIARYYWH